MIHLSNDAPFVLTQELNLQAGLFVYFEAAKDISNQRNFSEAQRDQFTRDMLNAIASGELKTRNNVGTMLDKPTDNSIKLIVHFRDINIWLEKRADAFHWKPTLCMSSDCLIDELDEKSVSAQYLSSTISQITQDSAILKKSVLIQNYKKIWTKIESDFHDSSSNGLSNSAKEPGHGMWNVAKALEWAKQRGKLINREKVTRKRLATPFSGL